MLHNGNTLSLHLLPSILHLTELSPYCITHTKPARHVKFYSMASLY